MTVYFAGLDFHNCVVPSSEGNSSEMLYPLPVNIGCNLKNTRMRVDLIVFQKVGNVYSWFAKGDGFPQECELLRFDLKISQVCLAANMLIGFSEKTNSLYKIDFSLNYNSEFFSWNLKQVQLPDTLFQVKQIATNDKSVFVLDDCSNIFEVAAETLILKWRLDGEIEIQKLSCGFGHFTALTDTGAVYSWGSGGRRELGHFDHDHVMVNCEEPKRIQFFDDLPCIVKDISCGGWHTLALTSDGDIYSWGWNVSGQLGIDSHRGENQVSSFVGGVPYPVDLGSATDPVAYIASGARHSLALLKSGKCYSFGLNSHGQLGDGTFDNKSEPVQVKFVDESTKVVRIECGRWSSFLYCE
ncbi:RCC1 domain-containing protein 1 [Folsomia candida]|uniref:RCC1 domain-containing protein 1 n=1 Tax=Folsomia candida TaxID=158441 RepID=UPI000B8F4965|nr:RCC1 domain-containing protein 1 [Folsomia candida]